MMLTERVLTLEDFLQASEQEPALEYLDGVITRKVSPKGPHSRLQFVVADRFNAFAEPRKLGSAFPELRATYGGASTVPDVSVYRWERIPRDARGRVASDFVEAPDIAIEIVSPGQSVTALVRRCVWYVASGVRIALLLDPDDESILLFRPGQPLITMRESNPVDVSDVLPGFALVVRELFEALVFEP